MDEILHPGRLVWISTKRDEDMGYPATVTDVTISRFRRLLPRGPIATGEPPAYDGFRERDLVEFWSDRGRRVVAVADICLKDPRKAKK